MVYKEYPKKKQKIEGGTRIWTRDLSICSRMLCPWAMPPTERKGSTIRQKELLFCKPGRAYNKITNLSS